uniref:WWE domain-containing protein n=1 Tax=Elaeophora elaphi TaxID=1147741 RepID=A0A0R3RV40_9BILA
MATITPGEASETDDDNDSDCNEIGRKEANNAAEQNDREIRNWNLNEAQQRSWSFHVDEKLEERWRLLSYDTVKLVERQAFVHRKQFENLKQNLSNIQHSIQFNSQERLIVKPNISFR